MTHPSLSTEAAKRLADLQRSSRRLIMASIFAIVLFFGGLGTWAALAPLDSAAIAPGIVIVQSNRKTVQHLEGGIVAEILVKEGDHVEAGQVLVRLDDTRVRAILGLLQNKYNAALALEARYLAERDGLDEIEFPDALLDYAGESDVVEMLVGQVNIFEARRDTLAGAIAIFKQRIVEFGEEIVGLGAQVEADQQQIELIAEELEGVRLLVNKGLARKPRLLALQRRAAELGGDRGEHLAFIARAKQNMAETDLQILDLQNRRTNQVVNGLREVQTQLSDLDERLLSARDVFERTEIRASRAGVVVDLQIHTVGGVIAGGEVLLDIVPQDDKLSIEVKIDPDDIDIVHVGLDAQLRLTAYNRRMTPTIDGKVIYVSADRLTDPQTGLGYYKALIEVDANSLDSIDGVVLYPGMTAQVMIVTGQQTVMEYILSPLMDSFSVALREQ